MKTKAIRSLRLANILAANGHKILNVEPSVDSPGFTVFIFEDTPRLQQVLTDSNRKNTASK